MRCREWVRRSAGELKTNNNGVPMNINDEVLQEVRQEIQAAMAKFPQWPTDPLHAIAVLGEEYGELQKAVLQTIYEPHKSDVADVRKEAIQTAAMALRFCMSLEHYQYLRCEQHTQNNL